MSITCNNWTANLLDIIVLKDGHRSLSLRDFLSGSLVSPFNNLQYIRLANPVIKID